MPLIFSHLKLGNDVSFPFITRYFHIALWFHTATFMSSVLQCLQITINPHLSPDKGAGRGEKSHMPNLIRAQCLFFIRTIRRQTTKGKPAEALVLISQHGSPMGWVLLCACISNHPLLPSPSAQEATVEASMKAIFFSSLPLHGMDVLFKIRPATSESHLTCKMIVFLWLLATLSTVHYYHHPCRSRTALCTIIITANIAV